MKLKHLFIMRHAKSDWSTASNDFERPLNQRGKDAAIKMGFWLTQQEIKPQIMVSSPALRARQTAEIVSKQTGRTYSGIIWDKRIYEASRADLIEVIAAKADSVSSLLLVGHNPGLDDLVKYLSDEMPPFTMTGKLMTTAAIAVIDFHDGFMGTAGCGTVVEVARPKEI